MFMTISQKSKVKSQKGLIISYFGDGKGKTTAALGLALRAVGHGKKVRIIQFIKAEGPPLGEEGWESGEELAAKKIPGVELEKYGLGFIGFGCDRHPLRDHRVAAQKGLAAAKRAINSKKYFVVVLDEIFGAIEARVITKKQVIDLLGEKPASVSLVLTGRKRIKEIIARSDMVSEIKKIKHPFDHGPKAIRGLDY